MQVCIRILRHRRMGETGTSAVEFGLLVALIAAVIVMAAFALGGLVQGTFSDACSAVTDNAASTGKVECT